MKTISKSLCAAALAVCALPSLADSTLAMQSGCLGCHKKDAKLVGPSFQEISAKYREDPAQVDRLVAKVKGGSPAGDPLVWGQVPMPASPAAEADIKTVITWMLVEGR